MFSPKIYQLLTTAALIPILSACGGGGGKSTDNNPVISASSTSLVTSSSISQSSTANQALTRKSTPIIASSYLDIILFAKDTAAAIVKGEYNSGLPDGSYNDSCDGKKGSFEITISKNGALLNQKYANCEISIVKDGVTEKLLISGEESVSTTRNENTYSMVDITWKNYSVSINGGSSETLDGSFNYQGFLNFNSNVTYANITSRIKINAKMSGDGKVINANNIDLTYNFPRIFDSYPSPGWGNMISPQGLHIFAGTIISAQGTLGIDDLTSDFLFDSVKQQVTFSNSATEKGYLNTSEKGFYIRWDENNDGLMDANVFLSEDEYPVISEHLSDQTSKIYFSRYPKDYGTPLPPNHIFEGQYSFISLSKGATTEIDVREMFTNKSGALLTYEIDNKSLSADWEQLEAGRFKLKFPNSNGTETFNLKVTALDIYNNRSPEIKVTVQMNDNLADTDKDGILDINDPDIDNDGTPNNTDSFPKNPTESSDLDFDGIGDNTDPDRDGDGIANTDDATPNDGNCHTATSADEYGCYLTGARYAFNDGDIIYFIQRIKVEEKKARLVKFDTKTNQFLAPSPVWDIHGAYTYVYAFDTINGRALMGDGFDNKLYFLNVSDLSITPTIGFDKGSAPPNFFENGYFGVQRTDTSNYTVKSWIEVFDKDGNLTDSNKEESLNDPNYLLGYSLQKSVSVPFCKFSISIGTDGKLIKHNNPAANLDACWGVNSTSSNLQYTFPQQIGFDELRVYDTNGNKVLQFVGYQLHWLDNALVYFYPENYSELGIAVNDFTNNRLYTFKSPSKPLGDIYVVGQKVISFQPTEYMKSVRLLVLDKELNVEFDSLTK